MKVEVKNVKIAKFASEETLCFQATLYVDGKKTAAVSNDGRGGCNRYSYFDPTIAASLNAYCKTLPPSLIDGLDPMPMDLDLLVDSLIGVYEKERQFKKWCKKETVFRIQGDPVGHYRTIKSPFSEVVKQFIETKYPGQIEEILNEKIAS